MIPTAHISANKEDLAETIIMPGDPLRSQMTANTFLENPVLVNNVRGVQGYTGYYKGKKITVMASGMGNPTMGIYSYELFKFYDVKKIIRIGSIGAMREDIKIKDIILAKDVYTNTNYNNFYKENGEGYITGDFKSISEGESYLKSSSIPYHVGNILCSDTFYSDEDEVSKAQRLGLLGVEMESAALYLNAKRTGKEAMVICTVSNNIITGEETTSDERQNAFKDMVRIALELA
jgi:purine-nucleoside phosphorylase